VQFQKREGVFKVHRRALGLNRKGKSRSPNNNVRMRRGGEVDITKNGEPHTLLTLLEGEGEKKKKLAWK